MTDRLGLPANADPAKVREALSATTLRWQTRAESPMSSRDLVDAARVLVRTCEGMATTANP